MPCKRILDVHKTASKEFESACRSGRWLSNQANRCCTEPWIIFYVKKHVSNVRRPCYFQLRQLRVVRRSLPSGVLRLLVCYGACCMPLRHGRLDYCNSLMAGLPLHCVTLNDFRRSRTSRHVSLAACKDGAVFFQCFAMNYTGCQLSKQLTLNWRHLFQSDEWTCTISSGGDVHPVSSNPALRRNRSADRGDLIIQNVKNISYGSRSFAIADPSFWNSLHMNLRSSSSLTEFKTNLKTYLFREAYSL